MPSKRSDDQVTLTISLPKNLKKEIVDYCKEVDTDASKYIRKLIREDEERYTTQREREIPTQEHVSRHAPDAETDENNQRGAA